MSGIAAVPSTATRVFLVDDQALVRGGFRMLIEAEDDLEVVGEASDGQEALARLRTTPADVVLMDVRMPVLDGVETTRRLLADGNPARVLVLTTFDLDEYVFAALKAGASGFLLKDARPDELLSAIRDIAAGDAVMAPSATRRLLDHVVPTLPGEPPSRDDKRLDELTARELEVLREIAAGATNPEIGARLYMAEGTVKTHVGRLLSKLGVRDRVGLVLFAFEVGLRPDR
ncbi:response regulator [Microlunatus flavus]|uniref:response regulator n=1 Tax=Microlunatus flavus TaxID=1036181 RepID=UPI0022B75A45|nr:response regulator transcription factor [Microlunatus flavus]